MANPEDEEDEDSPAGDEMNNLQSVAGQVRLFFMNSIYLILLITTLFSDYTNSIENLFCF